MQRPLIIGGIAFAVILLGVGAYFLFFSGSSSVTTAPGGSASLPVAGGAPGSGGTASQSPSDLAGGAPTTTTVPVAGRLVQITTGPVVPGEAVVDLKAKNASTSPEVVVSYIARESGNVFTYSNTSHTLTRINNKTIPGIQSATWLPDASAALVQYLSGDTFSTINTYSLAATSSNGFFLPQNLAMVAASSTGILSVASGVNGSAVSLSRVDGSKSTTLFTMPLTALRASFAGKNRYLLFSKPAASLSGDAFLSDAAGHYSRIAGPLNGLVALASPSGKWVLVSSVSNGTMQMSLIDTVKNTSTPLPVATIADKCVWTSDESSVYCGVPTSPSASATYPDDWYQGAVHFSDRIWKIGVAGRYAQLTLDFSASQKSDLDAEALAIDPASMVLTFVNKNDGSLWSYSL